MLAHPTPLTVPAAIVGSLPLVVRWGASGRPWRPSPFDIPLVLLAVSALVGMWVAVAPAGAAIRLSGLLASIIVFGWVREHARTPGAVWLSALLALAVAATGAVLMLHIAQPFLLLDRVPPLRLLAEVMEPLALHRFLVTDEAALQRFRLYASGAGAVAALGLSMATGGILSARGRVVRVVLCVLAVCFAALLLVADNRGSMLAAACSVGCLVVWWRPRLRFVAALLVFGTLDLLAAGLAQRGLGLRTVVERLTFWRNGLSLAAETPLTGVGLGVESVQTVYRAVFPPEFPDFSHAHNIFLQALLEQGIVGLAGLVLVCVAIVRVGVVVASPAPAVNWQARAASFVACGGLVALLVAGLTEIVALTTVGVVLVFGLLGILAAAHSAAPPAPAVVPGRTGSSQAGAALASTLAKVHLTSRAARRLAGLMLVGVIAAALAAVYGRSLTALPLLNLGTTTLYRTTLAPWENRTARQEAAALAVQFLKAAVAVDHESIHARRNLALALAAAGDRDAARSVANDARTLAHPGDADALYGIGRAYWAAEAWDEGINAWSEAGAGPQLLRVGRQFGRGARWPIGIQALEAAARAGAPGRAAQDALTRTALAHGESPDQVVGRLDPLIALRGDVGYHSLLQAAHVYREAGRFGDAIAALDDAQAIQRDIHWELERALLYVWNEQWEYAEPRLAWIVERTIEPAQAIPEGDDPHYWLAVSQARRGQPEQALRTARAGLAELPPQQATLRAPYALLLGDLLLDLDRPAEALAALEAGRRVAPSDPRLAERMTRARAALRR